MSSDVTRLPKWAQERIANLERDIRERDARIEKLSSVHEGSNVKVSGSYTYPDVSLPANSEVDFYLSESETRFRNTISVRHERLRPGSLYVAANSGLLVVKPVASNCIRLNMEDF